MTSLSKRPTPKRLVTYAISLLVLRGLWYAFRPEKLFTSTHVDEAPLKLCKINRHQFIRADSSMKSTKPAGERLF